MIDLNKWLPFSLKHRQYYKRALTSRISVAEGAVRASKTIINILAFKTALEITPDKIHLASGSTIANAKLNIGDCNGFGLEHLFEHTRWGKYKDNEALYIRIGSEEKIVIFAGGGQADSYKKILGNSYGLWIATEINEHYDSEDSKTSFIKVAMARQLASIMPRIYWDLNPSNPNATIYKWYLDKWQNTGLVGGYNYEHFTIFDNTSITEERIKEIVSQYDPKSIWYQRDILGKRVVAEGLIYQEFKDYHILKMSDWLDSELKKNLMYITIGVDFGGNISAHSFVAMGITRQFKNIIAIKQKRIANKIDDTTLREEFIKFIKEIQEEYTTPIIDIRCDSAEQVLIEGFRRALRECGINLPINNAIKGLILERIRFICKMFSSNKYYILECCEPLINAYRTSVWVKDKDERLDNGTIDIDSLDSSEYAIEPYMKTLIQVG